MTAKKKQSKSKQVASKTNPRVREARDSFAPANGSRLLGKVAVVTGGRSGIGLAIAKALAAEGASIVITGRNHSALDEAAEGIRTTLPASAANKKQRVLAVACDVRDAAWVEQLFAKVRKQFGRIDVLVNNAGIAQPMVPVALTTLELWREVIDTNLTGLFLCTSAALPLMKAGATIVNNLSIAAKTAFPNFAAYNASKHGALGFTRSLREELMSRGIRVVALMPGATDTEIWQQFWIDAPRERMIDAASVAQAVLYAALLPPTANLSELVLTPTGGAL